MSKSPHEIEASLLNMSLNNVLYIHCVSIYSHVLTKKLISPGKLMGEKL